MIGCQSWTKYSWEGAHCELPSWEGDPDGLCILHSLVPEKDRSIFAQVIQDKVARKDYDFREVFFPESVNFAGHIFNRPVNFHGARLAGLADFRGAEFGDEADFSFAKFCQCAIFEKAKFAGQADFTGIEVTGEADFCGVIFDGLGIFQQINAPSGASSRPAFTAFFQSLSFGPWGHLRFQDLVLAQVSFLATDVRRLEFHNVVWYSHSGRQAVYDEALLGKKNGPHLVALTSRYEQKLDYEGLCAAIGELYRYLKLNYEREGDLKQAGDFHYGEMEMYRRAKPWRRRFPLSWYNLYWALSGYGEKPLRALGWLLGVLTLLAIWLDALGLKNLDGTRVGLGYAYIWVLQQATLIHPNWAGPLPPGEGLISALSRILLPAQLALFILALRNRLGRRR